METKGKIELVLFFVLASFIVLGIFLYEQKDDSKEKDINWHGYTTYSISLKDSVTITEKGIYHLTGNLSNGMITVDTTSPVKLILDNVSITNQEGPAILITDASLVEIELKENTINVLEDGSDYLDSEEVGTIYSHDDLRFTGEGSLKVIANSEDAIVGKDTLTFLSGNYEIEAKDDGIRGKDIVTIKSGTYTIDAGGDGIKSTNDSDNEKVSITIYGGNFSLTTKDDAITSQNSLTIQDGNFHIQAQGKGINANQSLTIEKGIIEIVESYEGLEASNMTIKGGEISILSKEDGINVASDYKNDSLTLTIEGGKITLDTSGDGIDVNGSFYMSGGEVTIFGPTDSKNGAIDYDEVFEITGGTIMAGGSKGMDQAISTTSKIYGIWITFSSPLGSSDTITISDNKEEVLLTYHSKKNYSSLVIATPILEKGKTYHIEKNGEDYQEFTVQQILTKLEK